MKNKKSNSKKSTAKVVSKVEMIVKQTEAQNRILKKLIQYFKKSV